MKFLGIKNWGRFQHYKTGKNKADTAPPWIKLYTGLNEDFEFNDLKEATQIHLVRLWLLASRMNNKIPYEETWVRTRIGAKSKVDLSTLIRKNFLEILGQSYDDPRTILAPEEKRREEESFSVRDEEFNRLYSVYPKHTEKQKSHDVYMRLRKKNAAPPVEDLIKAVEDQKKNQWFEKHKQYIPSLRKWLFNAQWEDELIPPVRFKNPPLKADPEDKKLYCDKCGQYPCDCKKEEIDVPF